MARIWRPKPGDRVVRSPRLKRYRLRRVLGIPALYSAGYGNVGSSIYYALGIVAFVALGATPVALGLAGIFFIFTALTYAEGASMIPEAGGSASFARHGFNNTMGFIAGWALMLSYIVTISISAYTIPPYLGHFWLPLKESNLVHTSVAMGIVLFLMAVNVLGVKESSLLNIGAALLDIGTQLTLIIVGIVLILIPDFSQLPVHMFEEGNWPPLGNLVYGIALAALAYTGVETVSQMAEETRIPERRVPTALVLMTATVLVMFAGISIVAITAMTPYELGHTWPTDPVAGIAFHLPHATLRLIFQPLVGVLAATILLIATNAGLIGISRLAYSMGIHRALPKRLSQVHHQFKTPYVSIILFSGVALLILLPGLFSGNAFVNMGGLYTFGSLLAFTFAHASILALRARYPQRPRPFKLRPNLKIAGREFPVTAIIGFLVTFSIWVVVIVSQEFGRWVGLGWMIGGITIYLIYRHRARRSTKPESET